MFNANFVIMKSKVLKYLIISSRVKLIKFFSKILTLSKRKEIHEKKEVIRLQDCPGRLMEIIFEIFKLPTKNFRLKILEKRSIKRRLKCEKVCVENNQLLKYIEKETNL